MILDELVKHIKSQKNIVKKQTGKNHFITTRKHAYTDKKA